MCDAKALRRRRVLSMASAVAVALAGVTRPAAAVDWDVTPGAVGVGNGTIEGGTGNWDTTTGNWTTDGGANNVAWVNANNDVATFGGTAGTVTLTTGITANALTFNSTGYTVAGNTLTLAGTTPTINVTTAGQTATISSILAGTSGLTKTGAGTVVLSGVNTYTGGTIINQGAVSIAAISGLGGAGTTTLTNGGNLITTAGVTSTAQVLNIGAGGGTITVNSGTQLFLNAANLLTGSGALTVSGTYTNATPGNGNLRLAAANSYSGPVTISGGSIEYQATNAVAAATTFTLNGPGELIVNTGVTLPNTISVDGGTLSFENGNAGIFSGPITVGAGGIRVGMRDWYAVATARSGTISGALTGNAAMSVIAGTGGAATLNLTGNNTGYTGAYSVDAGNNIAFASANARSTGAVTISTTATRLGGLAFGYDFGGTPTFTNSRSGTTTGGVFGVNTTLAATTTLNMATLGGGGMFLGSTGTGTYAATTLGADAGTYRLGGGLGTVTLSGTNVLTGAANVIAGDTRVNGTGTVVLSAANDYTGTTTINGGTTLQISNAGALGSAATGTTVNAGGSLGVSGGINVTGEVLTLTGTSATASTTNLPNGLVNVSGNNTYSAQINANNTATDNARISSTTGTLTLPGSIVTANAATNLVLTGAGNITQTGVISGPAGLISTSTGTINVSDLNTYTGRTQVQTGTFRTATLNNVAAPLASSGLGRPTTIALGTIDLGNTTNTGILTYLGTGETTDRVINLNGTTGGGTIDQSGTGVLRFTSNLTAVGAGIKTFTLQGSSAGTGEFAGNIVNNSATNTTALTKTGSGTWTVSGANTYSGATNINNGVLVASSLNSVTGGTASSNLGTPTTAGTGTIGIGSTTNGATLRYTGTGQTTDRVINLAGTTGGATLDHAGTGTLTFSSAFTATGVGTKTLTLTGGAGGVGQINGAIVNNLTGTNLTNVTKNGLGTWVLGGTNTYTGATAVNAGVLRVTGSTNATSAVAVAANGYLGGTGTVNGAVTVAAGGGIDLRDGAVGNLTLGSTLALNGSATVPGNLYFDLGSSTVDTIAVTGVITAGTAGGTLVSFNQLAGTPLADGTYTLITSSATAASSNYALATTQSGGHTYALLTSTSSPVLRVTVGTAVTGAAGAFWNGSTSTAWTAAANWNTDATSNTALGSIPGVGTNVTFSTTTPAPVGANLATVLGADFEINSLTFASTQTAAVSIGAVANTLTIDATAANGNTLGNGISQLSTGTHTIAARVGIAAAQTWTVAAGGGLTVSGPLLDIGGSFKLTKAGAGTLTLSNAASTSTFTGDIDVTAGVLAFAGNNGGNGDPLSLGAGNKTITITNNAVVRPTSSANPTSTNTKAFVIGTGGGTFDVPTGVTFTLDDAGQFSGANDLTITGAGTGTVAILTQVFPFGGNVNVTSGTLRLSNGTPLGTTAGRTLAVSGTGTLDFTGTTAVLPLGITLNGAGNAGTGALISSGTGSTAAPVTLLGDSSAGGTGTLTASGNIGGAFRLTKVGTGTMTISGTNTYGNTTVSAGTLVAAKTASLPNYATAGVVTVASGATLAYNVGGTGEFTAADVTTMLGNSGTFASGSGIGFDTTNAAGGTFTAPALVPVPAVTALNLQKRGTNSLVIASPSSFGTGSTTVLNGTLSVTAAADNTLGTGPLTLGTSAGVPANLDLGATSQTVTTLTVPSNSSTANVITLGAGRTLTATGAVAVGTNGTSTTVLNVVGATGTFSVGTAATATNANFSVGTNVTDAVSNGATVDMSGLGTFYANLGTGTFRVGDPTNSTGTATNDSTLTLAADSTIRATTITTDSPDSGRTQTIRLGSGPNVLNATTIEIAGSTSGRSSSNLVFNTAAGTLNVRGLAGGTTRANLNVAYGATATGAVPVGTVNLLGHSADLMLGTLNVGGRTATGSGASTGTFSFDTGTLDVTGVNVGRRNNTSGTNTGAATGTVNLAGGTVTIGASGVNLANNTSTLASSTTVGTLNVSGTAVVTIGQTGGTSITLGSATNANGPATAAFNLTGGSTTLAGNIVQGGTLPAAVTSTLTLNGGTLNMGGNSIGTAAAVVTSSFQTGTLLNLGQLNGGAALAKGTAGTLILTGTNAYTGGTTITDGLLLANSTSPASSTGTGAVAVSGTGVLGGIGNIAGAVAVNAGGSLAPGQGNVGTMSIANTLTVAAAATYAAELTGGVSTAADRVDVTGLIDLSATGDTLNVLPLSPIGSTPVTVTIASYGTLSGTFDNVLIEGQPTQNSNPAGANYVLVGYGTTPNQITLTVANAAVPEPATAGLLGLAAAGLLARRRRARA